MDPYLKLIEQIGEGAFSKLYSAYDTRIKTYTALKIEKFCSKNSNLKTEYEIYKELSHLSCVPKIYNFIPNITNELDENKRRNCIEMELLGKNLLSFKKSFSYYNNLLTYEILIKCLQDIQKIHNAGYIHRDIKPSNFCLHKDDEKKIIYNYRNNIYFNHDIKVYLIDFGLMKKINNNEGETKNGDNEEKRGGFVGTLTYASISAHKREELGKKDDLCSFLFMILDLMGEDLPWRNIDCKKEEEIIECKKRCMNEPDKYLFLKGTKNNNEIMNIFKYIKNLNFETEPDYNYILNQLLNTNNNETLLNNNRISQQDYIIYKLNKANNNSIPSLNSTNYSSSIYYKTNYINCISGNNNENFYQSVLKPCNASPNNINATKGINYSNNNNNNKYNYNNMINIHPFSFKGSSFYNNIKIEKHNKEKCKKAEDNCQNDKFLIESLLGKEKEDSEKRKENKKGKNNKVNNKNKLHKKMNIHDKRKAIKFSIVKKNT